MNITGKKINKGLFAWTVLLMLLTAGYSSASFADDGQHYAGWECRPAGQPGQTSARYTEYSSDGSVKNFSSNYQISVICPVQSKAAAHYLEFASMNYTDNHPTQSIRCSLHVESHSLGHKVYFLASPSGVRAANLILDNVDETGTKSWINCTIPPVYEGKKSAINSYRVDHSTGSQPWYCDSWFIFYQCFDTSGIGTNNIPGNAARLTGSNALGQPYFAGGASYAANYSYEESLQVVYPIARDDLNSGQSPWVSIQMDLNTDNIGLAECRLFQSNNGIESGFELSWNDPDGDGRGSFGGSGDHSSVNSATSFTVKCTLPPRTEQGISRLHYVYYTE